MTNAELIHLCRDAFVYGSPLVSDSALRRFCRSREVADSLGLNIMQDFAAAVVKAPSVAGQYSLRRDGDRLAKRRETGGDTWRQQRRGNHGERRSVARGGVLLRPYRRTGG